MGTTITGPRYTHDCTACHFIARVAKYDLYTCKGLLGGVTYIARYDHEPSHYASAEDFDGTIAAEVTRDTGGLDQVSRDVLITFRLLRSLVLNLIDRTVILIQE